MRSSSMCTVHEQESPSPAAVASRSHSACTGLSRVACKQHHDVSYIVSQNDCAESSLLPSVVLLVSGVGCILKGLCHRSVKVQRPSIRVSASTQSNHIEPVAGSQGPAASSTAELLGRDGTFAHIRPIRRSRITARAPVNYPGSTTLELNILESHLHDEPQLVALGA